MVEIETLILIAVRLLGMPNVDTLQFCTCLKANSDIEKMSSICGGLGER